MFKGDIPSTPHTTSAMQSRWVALIRWAWMGTHNFPEILEETGQKADILEHCLKRWLVPKKHLKRGYALFTDGSCHVVANTGGGKLCGIPHKEAVEGEGKSSQFVDIKALQQALETAEQEKWLVLYTDYWMVAHALWGWLQQWKKINWQCRGKVIWAAALWQDITKQVENMTLKVHHGDAHVPQKSQQWRVYEQWTGR